MAKIDRKVLQDVKNDWMTSSHDSIVVKTIFKMLEKLEQHYGDNFSIEIVCGTLSFLSRSAERIKDDLEQEYNKTKK